MGHRVQLTYFRPTGRYLARAEVLVPLDQLEEIWEEVDQLRRLGRLPGLRPGAGRGLLVLVEVPDHPRGVARLVMAPVLDEDDVTASRPSQVEVVVGELARDE